MSRSLRHVVSLVAFALLFVGAVVLFARTAHAGPPGKICVPETCKRGFICFLVSSTPNCQYDCTDMPCEPIGL